MKGITNERFTSPVDEVPFLPKEELKQKSHCSAEESSVAEESSEEVTIVIHITENIKLNRRRQQMTNINETIILLTKKSILYNQ